jgi:hypothetical protein
VGEAALDAHEKAIAALAGGMEIHADVLVGAAPFAVGLDCGAAVEQGGSNRPFR